MVRLDAEFVRVGPCGARLAGALMGSTLIPAWFLCLLWIEGGIAAIVGMRDDNYRLVKLGFGYSMAGVVLAFVAWLAK